MYLRTVFGSIAERRAQLADPAPGMPVLEQFDYVDHSDRSPCHCPPRLDDEGMLNGHEAGARDPRPPGNSVTDNEGIP